ncbi:uncharacterized protein LOC143212120 isoform X2 [Lasioglossum baleicum]|uniref:uncharacterized protein LOC143212120 isoform X2 n=1 Tax=Lasioglossum baleicum TaxID=434251 RepID=UPI003FCDA9E9
MAEVTRKDETESDINSDTLEDVGFRMDKKRRKVPRGKKVMNREETKRTVTLSESSESYDFNSPPRKFSNTAHESASTQPSCSCQDEINSLKNYFNETIEKNCKSLSIQISQLGSQMVDVKAALEQLLERTTNGSSCDVIPDYEDNWKFLPCRTIEEFQKFDERIKEEIDFRQKLTQKFINIINKRATIVRNMGEILRFSLSRELALKCNPVKQAEGKLFVFTNTNLYNVVKAALLSALSNNENPFNESDIIKVVATVLHHCRDWEGGRVKRQKKNENIRTPFKTE